MIEDELTNSSAIWKSLAQRSAFWLTTWKKLLKTASAV